MFDQPRPLFRTDIQLLPRALVILLPILDGSDGRLRINRSEWTWGIFDDGALAS